MAGFSINIFKNTARPAVVPISSKDLNGFSKERAFNWKESYEVHQFVSRYMEYRGWFSHITAGKIDVFIKTRLPFRARTHYDVMIWLDTNFKK